MAKKGETEYSRFESALAKAAPKKRKIKKEKKEEIIDTKKGKKK